VFVLEVPLDNPLQGLQQKVGECYGSVRFGDVIVRLSRFRDEDDFILAPALWCVSVLDTRGKSDGNAKTPASKPGRYSQKSATAS
jgi:hypothetical protein